MKKIKVTNYKTKQINNLTGGKIAEYKIPDYPNNEGVLPNSFLTKDGIYIGDYAIGWWYVKNNMKIYEAYPQGVAEVYWNNKLIGYYGYAHRGGTLFQIGDRLFDPEYQPIKEDYKEDQWDEWEKDFNEKFNKADEFDKKDIYDNISAIIPFSMRGKKMCDIEGAKQAAINMSRYLS